MVIILTIPSHSKLFGCALLATVRQILNFAGFRGVWRNVHRCVTAR